MTTGNKAFEQLAENGWQIIDRNYGKQIALDLFQEEINSLSNVLVSSPVLLKEHIIQSGGNKSPYVKSLEKQFYDKGWNKDNINITRKTSFKYLDISHNTQATSHEVDHLVVNKNNKCIAMEIEWNTHKAFLNRDTQFWQEAWNFGAIELAILITRGEELMRNLKTNIVDFFANNLNDLQELENRNFSQRMKDEGINFNFPTTNQINDIKKQLKNNKTLIEAVSNTFYSYKFGGTSSVVELNKILDKGYLGRTPFIVIGAPDINRL